MLFSPNVSRACASATGPRTAVGDAHAGDPDRTADGTPAPGSARGRGQGCSCLTRGPVAALMYHAASCGVGDAGLAVSPDREPRATHRTPAQTARRINNLPPAPHAHGPHLPALARTTHSIWFRRATVLVLVCLCVRTWCSYCFVALPPRRDTLSLLTHSTGNWASGPVLFLEGKH